MDILERIGHAAAARPESLAHVSGDERLTYGDLWQRSEVAARAIDDLLGPDGTPVVVYGHKQPDMLVSFLAAVRSGHPYVPIDSASWPADRTAGVVAESQARLVIAVAEPVVGLTGTQIRRPGELQQAAPGDVTPVRGDQPFYVIYTSGSTGRPKGVQISRDALSRFVDWALTLAEPATPEAVWLNQAPFSFDLSVMDLYCALGSGATLFSLGSDAARNARTRHAAFASSGITAWVSTPSFADLCLADPGFGRDLLPAAAHFLFCGETLAPTTVEALHERFPGSRVTNTYGPTESTVAVTSVLVTEQFLTGGPLPVGVAKPGTTILIRDPDGGILPAGEAGEIVIAGDTVSLGYLHRPDLTEKAFTEVDIDGTPTPAYRTGDLGHLDPDGQLHFGGRLDNQIKLHGYRIELEDVENNFRRLADVQQAAVVAIRAEDGTITHLRAFVQLDHTPEASPLVFATAMKKRLLEFVPDYMIPKVITVVDRIPLTGNGKADRRALLDGRW